MDNLQSTGCTGTVLYAFFTSILVAIDAPAQPQQLFTTLTVLKNDTQLQIIVITLLTSGWESSINNQPLLTVLPVEEFGLALDKGAFEFRDINLDSDMGGNPTALQLHVRVAPTL